MIHQSSNLPLWRPPTHIGKNHQTSNSLCVSFVVGAQHTELGRIIANNLNNSNKLKPTHMTGPQSGTHGRAAGGSSSTFFRRFPLTRSSTPSWLTVTKTEVRIAKALALRPSC